MDNNTFDSQLKSALENLEVPLEPAAWSAFEQRFPAPAPMPDDAVDQAVLRSLEQLEVPYQSAHWEQLARQMVRIEQLRRRIGISKAAEAAILLLLLLLGSAYGFFGFEPYHRAAPQEVPAQTTPMAEVGKAKVGQQTSGLAITGKNTVENADNFFVPLDAAQRTGNQNIEKAGVVSETTLTPLEMASAVTSIYGENNVENRSIMLPFAPLSTRDLLTLSIADLLNPLKKVTPKAIMASHFYAVTYASLDQNRVHIGSETRQAQGYGGGLMVGYRPDKWGMEAGVAFSQKNYTPLKEVKIVAADNAAPGHFRSFANVVDADIVSVPVKVTRRMARFGKTTAHAVAGMTANVAIEKSYRYKKVFYTEPAPIGTPTIQQQELPENGQGLLEGGPFADNAYVTADLGLRVEHPLGKRLVAFVEPSYQFSVSGQGIGPKPAKINTVGIHAGVMASL